MIGLRSAAFRAAIAIGTLTSTVSSTHADDQPNQEPMADRLAALESEIRQLRAEKADADALVRVQAAYADATVKEVLKDAEARSTLMSNSVSATYKGDRLDIVSTDGNFLLHPFLHMQMRYIHNHREDATATGGGSDTQSGFEFRRVEFGFDGHVFTPNFSYLVLMEVDRHNGQVVLEEAWMKYRFSNSPYSIRAGIFKDPLDHEQQSGGGTAMAVERTLTANLLAGGDAFSQGVGIIYEPGGAFRAEVAFTDGIGSANQNYEDFPTNSAT